jgi:hypothetical protein
MVTVMGVMHNVRQVAQDETQRSVTNVGHTEPISGTQGLYLDSTQSLLSPAAWSTWISRYCAGNIPGNPGQIQVHSMSDLAGDPCQIQFLKIPGKYLESR